MVAWRGASHFMRNLNVYYIALYAWNYFKKMQQSDCYDSQDSGDFGGREETVNCMGHMRDWWDDWKSSISWYEWWLRGYSHYNYSLSSAFVLFSFLFLCFILQFKGFSKLWYTEINQPGNGKKKRMSYRPLL